MSYDNQFDHLIPQMTNDLVKNFVLILKSHFPCDEDIDTSPLLNLTIGVFIGSLINILDVIKASTAGEIKLIENIETCKKAIITSLKDLSFIKEVKFSTREEV